MNQTQIKYIREALHKRKRALLSKFYAAQQEPHEVTAAKALVEAWRKKFSAEYSEYEAKITAKIQDLEERAILGGEFNDIRKDLQALDAEQT